MSRLSFINIPLLVVALIGGPTAFAQTTEAPKTSASAKGQKADPPSTLGVAQMFKAAQTPADRQAAYAALAPLAASGDAKAQLLQARQLAKDKQFAQAMTALAPLITANDAAGLKLAANVMGKRSTGIDDPALALDINERLTDLGDLAALGQVAKAHLAGRTGRLSAEQIRNSLAEAFKGGAFDLVGYLADFKLRGLGGPVDTEAAIATLRQAIDAGEQGRGVALANALMRSDTPQAASEALNLLTQLAKSENQAEQYAAQVKLIEGHATGRFGPDSNLQVAIDMTQVLLTSTEGNRAIRPFLRIARRPTAQPEWRDLVLRTAQNKIEAGDETHISALFDVFAKRRDPASESAAQALLDRFGEKVGSDLVPGFLVEQAIKSGRPMAQSSQLAKVIAATKTNAALANAYVASTRNTNLFAFFMQDLAAKKGYYNGKLSGQMDSATVRALLRLCDDAGVSDVCKAGPLHPKNARTIARAVTQLVEFPQ